MRSYRMIGESTHATDSSDAIDVPTPPVERDSPGDDAAPAVAPREHGGRDGPEPTRYGDWEKNGRCIDF